MTPRLKLVCASAIAAALLAAPSAGASVVQADAVSTADDLDAYWTDQRMANATPAKVVLPGDPVAQEVGDRGPSTRAGPIPYTRHELTDTTAFPARVHGKV